MKALQKKGDEVYHVQTHPETSFKIPAQYIKYSHPTQRYLAASNMKWCIRLCYNRQISLKGEKDKNRRTDTKLFIRNSVITELEILFLYTLSPVSKVTGWLFGLDSLF